MIAAWLCWLWSSSPKTNRTSVNSAGGVSWPKHGCCHNKRWMSARRLWRQDVGQSSAWNCCGSVFCCGRENAAPEPAVFLGNAQASFCPPTPLNSAPTLQSCSFPLIIFPPKWAAPFCCSCFFSLWSDAWKASTFRATLKGKGDGCGFGLWERETCPVKASGLGSSEDEVTSLLFMVKLQALTGLAHLRKHKCTAGFLQFTIAYLFLTVKQKSVKFIYITLFTESSKEISKEGRPSKKHKTRNLKPSNSLLSNSCFIKQIFSQTAQPPPTL